jgi:transcription antitermination factor NusG
MDKTWSWYAIRVRSRCEKAVVASLYSKGYAHFLPLQKKQRSGGRYSELPLFPGYVFSRFDPAHRLPVLMIPGVVSIVSNGRELLAIGDSEIAAVRQVEKEIAAEDKDTKSTPVFKPGQHIQVCEGPLRGVSGIVISAAHRFPVIAFIMLLQRWVPVKLDSAWVSESPNAKYSAN